MLFLDGGETEILSIACELIRIEAFFYPALGMVWLYNSALRGIGAVKPTIVSSVAELCCKIVISLTLSRVLGATGIWFAAPVGWVLGAAISIAVFYRGKWEKRLPPKVTE